MIGVLELNGERKKKTMTKHSPSRVQSTVGRLVMSLRAKQEEKLVKNKRQRGNCNTLAPLSAAIWCKVIVAWLSIERILNGFYCRDRTRLFNDNQWVDTFSGNDFLLIPGLGRTEGYLGEIIAVIHITCGIVNWVSQVSLMAHKEPAQDNQIKIESFPRLWKHRKKGRNQSHTVIRQRRKRSTTRWRIRCAGKLPTSVRRR